MNRILALSALILVLMSSDLWSQPTFRFPTEMHNAGDNFCIDVKTRDFTDLLTLNFTITWDPTVIRFTGVQNLNFEDLDLGDFNTSQVNDGKLVLNWSNVDQQGVTIDRGIEETYVIFQLCFKAIGTFGKNSPICIAETPIPEVTRTGTNNINIGLFQEKGLIGVEVFPIVMDVTEEEVNQGDFVCVDMKVSNFINIVSMQFTIEYDSSLLEFDGVNNYNVLPGFNPNRDINNLFPSVLTMSWFNTQPVTLADSTSMIGLCFRAKGNCKTNSPIRITGKWTVIDAVTNDEPTPGAGINIGIFPLDGKVSINPCDNTSGLLLKGTCPQGMPGESVCVDVTADRFQGLGEVQFLIKWNPSVLEFVSAVSIDGRFNPTINTTGAGIGTVRITWTSGRPSASLTLPDGTKILRLCFKIIGDGTVSSSVSFTGNPAIVKKTGSNTNIGLSTQNGCVVVIAPPGLTLSAGYFEGYRSQRTCMDVRVANFYGVNKMQFTIAYQENLVRLDSVTNISVPGMTKSNFTNLGNGFIKVDWENPTGFGESLPDGSSAFQLCFTIIGDSLKCSTIEFVDEPTPIYITTEDNGDFNIGLNNNPGQICILDPGSFTVLGGKVSGNLDEVVCMDIKVVNFTQITSTQYSLNWDVNVAEYDHVEFPGTLPGLTNSNFDFTNTNVGILTLSWNAGTPGGVTLADSAVIFRVCFKIVGNAMSCSDVGFAEDPLDIRITNAFSGGQNIGLTNFDGRVCAKDYMRIVDTVVTQIGCPGSSTGELYVKVIGGTTPYKYVWSGTGQTSAFIKDLPEGTYTVTITDSSTPASRIVRTFRLTVSGAAPVAQAGPDVFMNCNNLPTRLDANGSTTGTNIRYQWRTLNTGGVVAPSDRTLTPTVLGAGTYVLDVFNSLTNCLSMDTAMVLPAQNPVADATVSERFNCLLDRVNLMGSTSSGNDLQYLWTYLDGTDGIEPGTQSTQNAICRKAGRYQLSVIERMTGCTAFDTVTVLANFDIPIADAGPDKAITCNADTLILGGDNTSSGPEFTYEWSRLEDGNIISKADESAIAINATGLYQIHVIDTTNGCTAYDTVRVIGDPNIPDANAGANAVLTCRTPKIQLNGTASSQGSRYEYLWTAYGGGFIQPGQQRTLTPVVSLPGIYQLMVRDTVNGCEDFSNVTISQNKAEPRATIPVDTINLGCRIDEVPVDAQGSSTGTGFTYLWSTRDGGSIQNPTSISTVLRGDGRYYFQVTDDRNGCTALDSILLLQDTTNRPTVIIAPPLQQINCIDSLVQLNAIGSSSGTNFTIAWGPSSAIVSGQNTLTPKVNQPGEYTLSILDNSNGCFTSSKVSVSENKTQPTAAVAKNTLELPCEPPIVQLAATGSTSGPSMFYSWATSAGTPVPGGNAFSINVSNPGRYILTVRDNLNGCTDTTSVTVKPNTNSVVASAGADATLTCKTRSIQLTGVGSSATSRIKFKWLSPNGNTLASTLPYAVTAPGTYILQVRDTVDGCSDADTVVIYENIVAPTVNAGSDQQFNCAFTTATISGTVNAGPDLVTFRWRALGGGLITNPSALTTTVGSAGSYVLEATNDVNGCSARDTVSITIQSTLEQAQANADGDQCQDFAVLQGNLPPGTEGRWTTTGAARIDNASAASAMVTLLPAGMSTFVWTLSTADCPNYSRDTVHLNIESRPTLRNEVATMGPDQAQLSFGLLANDDLTGLSGWTFQVIKQPDAGSIVQANTDGTIVYERPEKFGGSVEITYEVCSQVCPNYCDTAFLKINIQKPERRDTVPPNAITPNGDGMNDALVFEALLEEPNPYPDNELIVFNRWGDIVYQARPYLNDWQGTNNNGNNLPHGTYYFILRLNIAAGEILRGDVTILR
jgi:gliding motility-associated-like protein